MGRGTAHRLQLHLGTHVDAPLHYGSTCEGRPARTITDIALDELWCEALVLDLRDRCEPDAPITVEALESALADNGAPVPAGGAVLLRTGQERYGLSDPEFFRYPGMSRESTLLLADLEAKVLGTDAAGWDLSFPVMARKFRDSGDNSVLWDGHRAGREREVFIVQQLTNLAALPPSEFRVAFFPIKIARASAAPARVVAFV
ncbi:cyclase family protein [Streptomyces sanglieri]|uniref:Cyclase family protein n=1 Tax=Streptomyces sanglieri TaxID=193460 RepID=A0ABW2XAF4_9ACTN